MERERERGRGRDKEIENMPQNTITVNDSAFANVIRVCTLYTQWYSTLNIMYRYFCVW